MNKFNKTDGIFSWETSDIKLEFSEPHIQGFNDFVKLKDEKDIMYYYYTVKIFKKIVEHADIDSDEEIERWERVCERSTYDFPMIFEFKEIIKYQLNDNTIIDGQKIYGYNKKYKKSIFTEGFACDDFYELTKIADESGSNASYILYAGTTFDCQGDLNSSGVRTPYLEEQDIRELLECVSSFIQYSIDDYNKSIVSRKNLYKIKGNKIYEYNNINKNVLESIYVIGDVLDITKVTDNIETDFDRVSLLNIEDSNIILEDNQVINIADIAMINNIPTKESLHYNEQEIAQDFINILSDEKRNEFKTSTNKELLYKYKNPIMNRTWMCRDEHNFDIDYNSGDMPVAVIPVIEKVIEKIKTILKKTNYKPS